MNPASITQFCQRDRQTIAPGTTGTTDAMRVVLCLHRQAEIEDMRDGRYIESTRSHVGRHQNLHLAIAQRLQAPISHALV